MPSTLEALLVVAYFIVPGYLATWVFSNMVMREPRSDARLLVENVAFSMLFWVLASPIFSCIGTIDNDKIKIFSWPTLTAAAVLGPVVLGVVAASFFDRFGRPRGFRHPTPTAWDYRFGKNEQAFVIVTLNSGDKIAGLWSGKSFAANSPNALDLYLERAIALSEENKLGEYVPNSAGFWVAKEAIRTIEFFSSNGG